MTTYFEKLEADIRAIVATLGGSLSADEQREIREFIDAGEYGVAFETLCYVLEERQVDLSNDLADRILALAHRMNIDERHWRRVTHARAT